MNRDAGEVKRIWNENTLWQNICWIGNTLLVCVMLPFYFVKELFRSKR